MPSVAALAAPFALLLVLPASAAAAGGAGAQSEGAAPVATLILRDGGDARANQAADEASADDAAQPEGDEDASLAEILASEALLDEPRPEDSVDDSHWVLQDVLRRGFAQTPRIESLLERDRDWPLLDRSLGDIDAQIEEATLMARVRGLPAHQAREVGTHVAFDIPVSDHRLVDMYIDYFTGRGRWFFERWLERADRYIPMMQPILREKGLPQDLVYVAMIESGFSSRAVSWAQAAGFWQFIGSTGRIYKLQIDVWVDERRDFVRATEAAGDYLSALHREFGDWYLAWAGYNAGEGRVRRAIAKSGTRDFWEIIELRHMLAKETQHYVPKVIAAAIIAKDRERYGFARAPQMAPLTYDEIDVEDATELGAVAEKFGFDLEELSELNPALTYGVTPPGRCYKLRVPAGRGVDVAAWLSGLPREQRLSYDHHTVQHGDSLSRIAHQYGSSIDAIREFNHIRNVRALRAGQTLIIPIARIGRPHRRALAAVPATAAAAPATESARAPATATTLTTTSAALGEHAIEQRGAAANAKPLVAKHGRAGRATERLAADTKRPTPVARHVVAAGETLWSIAQRYGVTVQRIKSWNGRRNNSIGVGEVLRIYTPET